MFRLCRDTTTSACSVNPSVRKLGEFCSDDGRYHVRVQAIMLSRGSPRNVERPRGVGKGDKRQSSYDIAYV